MSPTIAGKEVENEEWIRNTSEVTNSSGEAVLYSKSDNSQIDERVEKTKTGENINDTEGIEEIQESYNKKSSFPEKDTKADVQQIADDCYYKKSNPFISSNKQPTPLTYPIPCPWPPTYTAYNGMGGCGVVSTTTNTPFHRTENDALQPTENESKNSDMLASHYVSSTNYNRNGLVAILDAVHQRELLSTAHSIGSNVAESSSLGKESSESHTKSNDGRVQQTQQSNQSSSFRRSSHSISKQGSDERIPTPFLRKLYRLVSDLETEDLCSWTASGRSFVIWNPTAFARDVLPNYFKHNNLSSFVRQLNQYGFHKMHPDAWEFGHARFIRGREDLVATIERRPSRPGKGRWNDRDDESHQGPLQKRPKTESFNSNTEDGLVERPSKTSMQTKVESIQDDQYSPSLTTAYGRNFGASVVSSSNRLTTSAITFWQSYQPFILNDTSHHVVRNGTEATSSSSPQFRYPQHASSLAGAVPWMSSNDMPTTELDKRICMIEQAIAQLCYTINELCRDRDCLRHDVLSMRKRIEEPTIDKDGRVSKEEFSKEQA